MRAGPACKAGLTLIAGALFTGKEVAEILLKLSAIKSELDGVTYESEIANAAPFMTTFIVDLIKEISIAELMKMIKCFVAGTQIAVASEVDDDGVVHYTTRNIEDLKVGDPVLAREEFGDTVTLRRVTQIFRRVAFALQVLEFTDESGETQTLQTTGEHPFWLVNRNEFRPAKWLTPGDTFAGPNGQIQTLTSLREDSHPLGIFVYNFSVDTDHTYYVSETKGKLPLLVHNANNAYKATTTGEDGKSGSYDTSRNVAPSQGPGGGRKHKSHGRGSENSGAAQARARDAQDTLRLGLDAKQAALEKATQQLNSLKAKMRPADFKLILGKLTEQQWIRLKQLAILGEK